MKKASDAAPSIASGSPRGSARERRLFAWDRAHLWHPFTPMSEYARTPPFLVERARGARLYDVRGRGLLDAVSSLWCNTLGHRHPALDRAVRTQLSRVAHTTLLGVSHVPAILLARKLARLAPAGLTRVFFSDNGSTAVEAALKLAYQFRTQASRGPERRRTRFVTFVDAYHGDTIGSVSLGGIPLFHRTYAPLLFDSWKVPSPGAIRRRTGASLPAAGRESLRILARTLERHGREVTALVMEPLVQGAAGMLLSPDGFLREARRLTRKSGVLLVLDEVATGVGRTGRLFACQHEGVSPDFLCLAKGLTGGYLPLAATLTTEPVYRRFLGRPEAHRTFFHGHTYTGNPLAAAAALATLEIVARPAFLAAVRRRAARLEAELERFRTLPVVGEIRQRGLMAAVDLWRDPPRQTAFPERWRIGYRTCVRARRYGVLARPLGDTLIVNPPLSVSEREIRAMVAALARATEEVAVPRASLAHPR